jgi:ketosteroid isomerase-like protein
MDTAEVGRKYVELCKQGKNLESIDALFAADVSSEEAMDSPSFARVIKGKAAVREKNVMWYASNEVHRHDVSGPYPNGDEFAVFFAFEFTPKAGPMSGQRIVLNEVGLFTVKAGQIVREKYYYSMG